jgi:pumilio RNA-binding family
VGAQEEPFDFPVAAPRAGGDLTEAAAAEEGDEIVAQLAEGLQDAERRPVLLEGIAQDAWPLASTPCGCRVVQKAFEVAETAAEREALVAPLQGHVVEAAICPHANHVLQKCIEVLPTDKVQFVLEEMKGNIVAAARHRYACRVLERLIEHCPWTQTADLVEEVLANASQLCRHTFGNFVVQHVLEHGNPSQKQQVVNILHADIQRFARHRVASYVVRSALVHSMPEERQRLVTAMRADAGELADLAHHHCGSFVVREMRRGDVMRQ